MLHGIATSDFSALADLKAKAVTDAKGAAPEVAKQFEGIFLQSMLKSMRMGQHFLDDSSPFRGKNRETFEDMLDAQYASNIAGSKGIGVAAMLTRHLGSVNNIETPAPNAPPTVMPTASADMQYITPKQAISSDTNKPPTTVDDFVQSIWPKAKEAASLIGLDPKILMAQAALETGWGKFITKDSEGNSSNNLFNIKSGANSDYDSVNVKTTEYIADTPIKVNASFRKYSSIEQGFEDYISLIKRDGRYQDALASAANPESYVRELHKAGYATDPEYSTKILSIYRGDELNQAIQRCDLSAQV
ncbi:flagellar assembly peptidoglycan hydrolase FlgJ [Legionella lytica]|uniref:Peptidoglycan hydrolase FlgJ n=1 Tax=Legionella lytica TaxID=96232 RepID=A0ABY4Y6B5_9GAMM|nr:flagellar assembly peptidoglycan hydrolase FlgJ [Legionella lytica]USQ13022.1 flagellar assembly peptidoglycan hydrolase FlgJ [Legionella lytica]